MSWCLAANFVYRSCVTKGGTSRKGYLRTLTFSEPPIRNGLGYALTVGYLPPAVQTGVDLNGSHAA
jgi:hypothetical protein